MIMLGLHGAGSPVSCHVRSGCQQGVLCPGVGPSRLLLSQRHYIHTKEARRYFQTSGRLSSSRHVVAAALYEEHNTSSETLGGRIWKVVLTASLGALIAFSGASARLEGVNRPELLPAEYTPVIDVAGFLTDGEEKRLRLELENLERDTGIKLRVLAQNYPETPGLAIKNYWGVDDNTVVFVADPSLGGNILNFNVGANVDLQVPRNFWTRLSGKYGTKFYWQDRGEEAAIKNAVSAIDTCLREPVGRGQCSLIQGEFGEEPSSGPFGKFFGGK